MSRWRGKTPGRKTRSVTVSGCSLFLVAVTTWPVTEKSLSTGALVTDIVRYLRATWAKYGNVTSYFFHHTKGFKSTRISPSMYFFPTTVQYVSTSSLSSPTRPPVVSIYPWSLWRWKKLNSASPSPCCPTLPCGSVESVTPGPVVNHRNSTWLPCSLHSLTGTLCIFRDAPNHSVFLLDTCRIWRTGPTPCFVCH